jgi:hypothetical protein
MGDYGSGTYHAAVAELDVPENDRLCLDPAAIAIPNSSLVQRGMAGRDARPNV